MKMPTLYKVDSKGKIREWNGWTEDNKIIIEHGLADGVKQTKITECYAKNIGKINETSPEEQAELELESKYNKQLDKQYTTNIEKQIKQGKAFRPMLAHKYMDHYKKIMFPAIVQPKLDGTRCFFEDGKPYSRNGKPVKVIDHISIEVHEFFSSHPTVILDGELYLHGKSFQKIIGAVKRDNPNNLSQKIEYHIYDFYDTKKTNLHYFDRLSFLEKELKNFNYLKLVPSYKIYHNYEIDKYHNQFIEDGYEGLMIRNNSLYEQKRSYNLQKVKSFLDEEFQIIDIEEDKNNEAVFICYSKNGNFKVKSKGSREYRQSLLDENYIGWWIKVEFFEYTDEGLPRFPIGIYLSENKDDIQ